PDTLSLHDALPIYSRLPARARSRPGTTRTSGSSTLRTPTSCGAKSSSTRIGSARTRASRFAAALCARSGEARRCSPAARSWSSRAGASCAPQASASSRKLAGDRFLVGGQEPAFAYHHASVNDHGLSAPRRRQRQRRHCVGRARVSEVVDAEASDVGALACFERAAVVASQALRAALRGEAPCAPRVERLRRCLTRACQQQGLVNFEREVRVLVAGSPIDAQAHARARSNQVRNAAHARAK